MVKTRIWQDSWFATLSESAQRLYLYLITNKNTRISGYYELPMFELCGHMRLKEQEALKLLKQLEPKVLYHMGWVYISKYPEHQNVTNNAKVQAAIEKELEKVPQEILNLKSEIINHKSEGMDTLSIGYQNAENGLKQGENSSGKKSGKHVDNVKSRQSTSSLYDDERFERWWAVYPKKVGKGEAWKSWQKLAPSANLGEKIISVTLLYAQTTQWKKENGQFVPNPATFLNQRRFDDTPQGVEVTKQSKYQGL